MKNIYKISLIKIAKIMQKKIKIISER